MIMQFLGDIADLTAGIACLSEDLGITLGEGGYTITVIHRPGADLSVSFAGETGTITYSEKCHFFRAFGLAVEHLLAGEQEFTLTEHPNFRMNGPMFDMSQGNAAFNIPTVKYILRRIALMGLNTFMLYCEDSFAVENQPYFGYMRARYTEGEMRELDDYADALGIEMIPCIQTLAHLPDALRWECYDDIRDYAECLLVGEEKTYDFIRDLLTAATRPFRTKKIHIGMDEAWTLGRGKYIDTFGYEAPWKIMEKHLARVMEIVREMGLQPMMWDDMFFRTFGDGTYNQPTAEIPEETRRAVPPEMRCIYWDYYRMTQPEYEARIAQHRTLCENMIFAGAVWTWVGFSLAWNKTRITTDAALTACKKLGIRDVMLTVWGDNGTECLATTALIGCQLYAEHGYAEVIDYDKFERRFRFCTGGRVADFARLEDFDRNPLTQSLADHSSHNASKYLMWQDILTGLCDKNIEGYPLDKHYAALAEDMKAAMERGGAFADLFHFNYRAAHVLALKSQIGLRLTAAYRAGDREVLAYIADVELTDLRHRFAMLREVHRENWFALYKPLGWDVMDMRYGSMLARIDSAVWAVHRYLSGEVECMEELDVERLPYGGKDGPIRYLNFFGDIISPSRIAPKA